MFNWVFQALSGINENAINGDQWGNYDGSNANAINQLNNYQEELLEVTAVSTMEMVWRVCQNNTFLIRKDMSMYEQFQDRLSLYRAEGHRVNAWTAGSREHYAGYHCSWCYRPDGIRFSLSIFNLIHLIN